MAKSTILSSILIVDDDPVVRHILQAILTNLGNNVTSLASGEEFLAYLKLNSIPKIIFVDLYLGDYTAFELIAKAREMFQNFDSAIIMLSANSEDEITQIPGSFAPDFFLQKPFSQEEVKEVLAQVKIASS